MKKKLLYIIFDSFNEKKYSDNIFFKEVKKKFNLKIIDTSLLNKKKFLKKKNTYYPANFNEFEKLIKNKDSKFISYLENSINTFKILNIIHKNKKKIFKINNNAAIEEYKIILNKNFFNNVKKLYKYIFIKKIFNAVNIFLIYLNLLPKFDIIFECSQHKIKKYNKVLFKKIIRIKSNSFDKLIYNKIDIVESKIVFLDSNFSHNDRIFLDSNPNKDEYIEYLNQLKRIFKIIEIKFNSKVIICLHPTTDIKLYKNIFNDHNIVKGRTHFYVKKSKLVLFHETSSVLDAIILNKKIINLQGKSMGRYFQYRNRLYNKEINLQKIKLEDPFKAIKKINFKKSKNYLSFIKNNLSDDIKQYNKLKELNFKIKSKNFKRLKVETGAHKTIQFIL